MATYAGRYDEVLLRKAGNRLAPPVANTTVLVYQSDGSTTATLYTDRTKATTAANPVSVDASGNLEFFAEPGTYVLSIRESGSQVATNTVTVPNDPAESTGGGGATNLTWTASTSTVASDTGTDAVLTAVDATNPGLMTVAQSNKLAGIETAATADQTAGEIKTAYESNADTNAFTDAEQTKLAGIETAATANSSDATLLARANHTGTQAQSTVTDLTTDLAAKVAKATFPVLLQYAISDETTALTTGTAKLTARAPFAFTLTGVRASLTTASTSGIPTFDVNEGGVSVLSTKLTIDANEKTSTTAATAAVISDSAIADDAELTFDIDVAGTGAAGAKIYLLGTRVVA